MAYKIMVVDDEKMLTGLLSDHLRDNGYLPYVANNVQLSTGCGMDCRMETIRCKTSLATRHVQSADAYQSLPVDGRKPVVWEPAFCGAGPVSVRSDSKVCNDPDYVLCLAVTSVLCHSKRDSLVFPARPVGLSAWRREGGRSFAPAGKRVILRNHR